MCRASRGSRPKTATRPPEESRPARLDHARRSATTWPQQRASRSRNSAFGSDRLLVHVERPVDFHLHGVLAVSTGVRSAGRYKAPAKGVFRTHPQTRRVEKGGLQPVPRPRARAAAPNRSPRTISGCRRIPATWRRFRCASCGMEWQSITHRLAETRPCASVHQKRAKRLVVRKPDPRESGSSASRRDKLAAVDRTAIRHHARHDTEARGSSRGVCTTRSSSHPSISTGIEFVRGFGSCQCRHADIRCSQ
jgi:hypothetical protein